MDEIREALESMVWQFAHSGTRGGKPILHTGGLSALEYAFEALGWADPYYLSDAETETTCCEVMGCYEQSTIGSHWGDLYLRLCSKHGRLCWDGGKIPAVKSHAIEREANRGPDGCLQHIKDNPILEGQGDCI